MGFPAICFSAQEALDHFTHGAFFIPLTDDTDSNQFISRLAQQSKSVKAAVHCSIISSSSFPPRPWWPADRVEAGANQEFLRSALGEVEISEAQKKGRAMTLEQALTFASEA